MTITQEVLSKTAAKLEANRVEELVKIVVGVCEKYDINTLTRQACFLSHIAHKTSEFASMDKLVLADKDIADFSTDMGMDEEAVVDYLATDNGAITATAWLWKRNNLNDWADKGDVLSLTKKLNGNTKGLNDRVEYYQLAKSALETRI